jgi:acetolactate synthase-1/2/3 large subunit
MVNKQKISDIIVSYLENNNIDTIFGVIGSANSHIFDSLLQSSNIKVIYTHHEQAAVVAAGSYYRATGKLAVALVTAGGGAINALTGVLSNWADSIPCIVLSGQESTKYMKEHANLRMIGTQGFFAYQVVKSMTKYADCITTPADILYKLDQAFYECTNGRPGPVWLDIPFDIQSSFIEENTELQRFQIKDNVRYDSKLSDVLDLLQKSSRPVILGGHGIRLSNSKELFNKVIDKFKIPTLLSWSAIDLIAYDNECYFGSAGLYGQRCANFVVQNCDLLIVIGSRLALPQTGYNIQNFAPNAKIIIINNDIGELNKHSRYDIKILDDCNNFLNNLYQQDIQLNISDWQQRCRQYRNDFPLIEQQHLDDDVNYDNSYVLINKLSKLINDNDVVVIGQGTPLACAHQALELKSNNIVFASNGLGEMGHGLPSAIGAAAALPDRQIILLDGDGSMMMNLQELQTIVGYNLPIKIIIFNNEGYLFIKHTQKMLFEGRYTGVDSNTGVTLPNFDKIANAFGISYKNTHTHTLFEFLHDPGSCIFECFMNPEQDLIPKVKGIPVVDGGILAPPLEEMSPLLPIEVVESNMISVNDLTYKIRS